MRQLQFGRMDLSLHMHYDPQGDVELDDFIKDCTEGYLPPVKVERKGNLIVMYDR